MEVRQAPESDRHTQEFRLTAVRTEGIPTQKRDENNCRKRTVIETVLNRSGQETEDSAVVVTQKLNQGSQIVPGVEGS